MGRPWEIDQTVSHRVGLLILETALIAFYHRKNKAQESPEQTTQNPIFSMGLPAVCTIAWGEHSGRLLAKYINLIGGMLFPYAQMRVRDAQF